MTNRSSKIKIRTQVIIGKIKILFMRENRTIMITGKIFDLKALSKIMPGETQILILKDIEIIRIMTEEIFMRIGKIIILQEMIIVRMI